LPQLLGSLDHGQGALARPPRRPGLRAGRRLVPGRPGRPGARALRRLCLGHELRGLGRAPLRRPL